MSSPAALPAYALEVSEEMYDAYDRWTADQEVSSPAETLPYSPEDEGEGEFEEMIAAAQTFAEKQMMAAVALPTPWAGEGEGPEDAEDAGEGEGPEEITDQDYINLVCGLANNAIDRKEELADFPVIRKMDEKATAMSWVQLSMGVIMDFNMPIFTRVRQITNMFIYLSGPGRVLLMNQKFSGTVMLKISHLLEQHPSFVPSHRLLTLDKKVVFDLYAATVKLANVLDI